MRDTGLVLYINRESDTACIQMMTEFGNFYRYRSIVKDLWWRHFMSILTSTFQLMGAILYCTTEIYCGFKHVILVSKTLHSTGKVWLMK